MDMLEALAKAKERHNTPCPLVTATEGLTPKNATLLREALAQPVSVMKHAWIIHALGLMGVKVNANWVGRHRRGECSCGS
jgi:hypothetical protein